MACLTPGSCVDAHLHSKITNSILKPQEGNGLMDFRCDGRKAKVRSGRTPRVENWEFGVVSRTHSILRAILISSPGGRKSLLYFVPPSCYKQRRFPVTFCVDIRPCIQQRASQSEDVCMKQRNTLPSLHRYFKSHNLPCDQ